jgi:hypothetical protein
MQETLRFDAIENSRCDSGALTPTGLQPVGLQQVCRLDILGRTSSRKKTRPAIQPALFITNYYYSAMFQKFSNHVTLKERFLATEGSLSSVTEILRAPEERRGTQNDIT